MAVKNLRLVKALLLIAGLIAIIIGGGLLFIPVSFEASAGIILDGDINLLSEIRAPGGALLVAGILIIAGALISSITFIALVLSTMFYLSYGFSRILGMMIDGVPGESIVVATVVEIFIGLLSLYALFHFLKIQSKADTTN